MSQGKVLSVAKRLIGDFTATASLTGATQILLHDAANFDESGGMLTIGDVQYGYTFFDPENPENDILVLSPALTADVPEDEQVLIFPPSEQKWATVFIEDENDAQLALIPHNLQDKFLEGVRDEDEQETVRIEVTDRGWMVTDIEALAPSVDGSYIDPESVPTNPLTSDALEALQDRIDENDGDLDYILGNPATGVTGVLEALVNTTNALVDQTASWDGRVSTSDYDPGPEDVSFTGVGADGQPVTINRPDGSVWFTRTRERVNYCTNPSFEINTNDWVAVGLTSSREAGVVNSGADDGLYRVRLTNSGVVGLHHFDYDNSGAKIDVAPGDKITASIYAQLVSGSGAGAFARLYYYDAADAILSWTAGPAMNLSTTEDTRLYVQDTVPANAVKMIARFENPTENDVWIVDLCLIEKSTLLGAYFDGNSYDGSWTSTQHDSISNLEGGKIVRMWELDNGSWFEMQYMGATLQDVDASEIKTGSMDGLRIADNTIPIDKMTGVPVTAGEALAAGDIVCILNIGGVAKAYKADADAGRPANGYVLEAYASGAVAWVRNFGYLTGLSGLQVGDQFVSATAGKANSAPPITVGSVSQRVGVAVSPEVVLFNPAPQIFII